VTVHLGILGGGQLGRMLALSARSLGLEVTVVDPSPDAPARVAAEHIALDYTALDLLDRFASVDVVTYEFENVPEAATQRLAERIPVFPGPTVLGVAQDRLNEKTTFQALGIDTPRFLRVDSGADVERAFADLGPLVLKTRRLGYDGKGQVVVRTAEAARAAFEAIGSVPAIAEELVPFEMEVSAIVCRGRDGSFACYPITHNVHRQGILAISEAPAAVSTLLAEHATLAAQKLAEHFSYVGVLALELFCVGGRLLANEFAPRVHNSGHWTIEGAKTSQFENHVRAVCGLPLGSAELLSPSVMVNLIGKVPPRERLLALPDVHLHDYGKDPRAGRKVGHVTARAQTVDEARRLGAEIERIIQQG
jgi:5-(carboxyamino)imidazole ribonucleotide synthase